MITIIYNQCYKILLYYKYYNVYTEYISYNTCYVPIYDTAYTIIIVENNIGISVYFIYYNI